MQRKALNNLPKWTRKQSLRSNWMGNVSSLWAHWAMTIHKHRHSMFVLGCMWTADQWTHPNVTVCAAVAFHVRARLSAKGVNTLIARTSIPLSWMNCVWIISMVRRVACWVVEFLFRFGVLECSCYPCPRSHPVGFVSCLPFLCVEGQASLSFAVLPSITLFYRCFRSVPGIIKSNQH